MSIDYKMFLERMKSERARLSLSQNEMGKIARMTQSHYAKAENGTRHFTFYELRYLCQSDIDLHYAFTGEHLACDFNERFPNCNFPKLICLLEVLIAACRYENLTKNGSKDSSFSKNIRYLQCAVDSYWVKENIFYNVRRKQGVTQSKMAQILGMDIKKLRDLENGRVMPDSELLCKTYGLYHISPAFWHEDEKMLIGVIQEMMKTMDRSMADWAIRFCENM